MRDYRAYIIGIEGHRFIRAENFRSDLADDAAAIAAAKKLNANHDVELWDGARFVARFSPDGKISSPDLAPFFLEAVDAASSTKVT
jgi:hypothetical protein